MCFMPIQRLLIASLFMICSNARTHDTYALAAQNLTSAVDKNDTVRGWVSQPNCRGTFDIITACLTTVFICTYSMLVLNLPSPQDSRAHILGRRVLWMAIGILGPEFPLTYAAGQWSRAKQATEAFKAAGYSFWTMRHAFFADMGGFVLHPREGKPFPVNAKQLLWLVQKGMVQCPEQTMEELWDKSKQDRIVKVITAIQVTYFVLQCIGLAAQSLAITTLELNTLAIVVCSLMTSYAWQHKGADVFVPFKIQSSFSEAEIAEGKSWKLTPLDFVDDHSPGYSVNVQPFMKMPVIPPDRPIQRIPDDRFPTNPYGAQEYLLCFATLVFTGIHLAAWNLSFPTHVERLLWRISSLTLFGITVMFWLLETTASWSRLGRWKKLYLWFTAQRERARRHDARLAAKRRHTEQMNSTKEEGKQFPRPWEFSSIALLAVVYGLGRIYLIVEAFLEFRELPASAYMNVNWAEYLPHTS